MSLDNGAPVSVPQSPAPLEEPNVEQQPTTIKDRVLSRIKVFKKG